MNIREKLKAIQVDIKAPKNLRNNFGNYNYRNAESICEAVKPHLERVNCSLVLEDSIEEVAGRIYVKSTATLMDNETDEAISVSAYARESESKKGMDDSQVTGATSSYARKYALNGMFLLDDTKDADTDEYHNTVNNAEVKSTLDKAKNYDAGNIPKSEEIAKEPCSDKQVKFIENLLAKKNYPIEKVFSQYKVSSLAELSKAQAKVLIDYFNKE